MKRLRVLVTVVTIGFGALAGVVAAPASADYGQVGQFADSGPGMGGIGSADGELTSPSKAAVNQSTGKLYVADTDNNRVQVFSPTVTAGVYDSQLAITAPDGVAIDQSTGDLYVSNADGVSKFDQSLAPAAGWSAPVATGPLAVDPTSGDVLVADTGASLIRRYSSAGVAGATIAVARPLDVAVDSTGDVIAISSTGDLISDCSASSAVERYAADGTPEGTIGALDRPGSVTVDPDGDRVVVAALVNQYNCGSVSPRIGIFDADGTPGPAFDIPGDAFYATVPGLVAVGGGSGRIYAVTRSPFNDIYGNTKVVVFDNGPPADMTLAAPSAVTSASATLNGTIETFGLSYRYRFQIRKAGTTDWTDVPDRNGVAIPGAATPTTVSEPVGDLEVLQDYEVQLLATGPIGTFTSATGTFTTRSAVPVVATTMASAYAGAYWLRGTVTPNNQSTTYWFEYGTTAAYGQQTAKASANDGSDAADVSRSVAGLTPGVVYHYRVVAENATGRSDGEDRTFTAQPAGQADGCPNARVRRQQHSEYLPDCRAYELVSPAAKYGAEIGDNVGYPGIQLGVDAGGDDVNYTGFLPLGEVLAGSQSATDGRRGPDGWTSSSAFGAPGPFLPAIGLPGAGMYSRGTSADQRTMAYFDQTTLDGEGKGSLMLRRADGSIVQIAASSPDAEGCGSYGGGGCLGQVWFSGMSPDGRHVVFASSRRLGPAVGLPGTDEILYEWVDDGVTGTLRVVNRTNAPVVTVLDPGPVSLGAFGYSGDSRRVDGGYFGMRHAISDGSDGHSRIFFQNPAAPDAGAPSTHLYLREDGTRTVELSAPESGNTAATNVSYLDASADGGTVYFWADGKLTDDGTAGGAIYRYDVAADGGDGDLVFIAAAPPVLGYPAGSFVQAPLPPTAMASDDGTRIYFQDGDDVRVHDSTGTRLVMAGVEVAQCAGSGDNSSNYNVLFDEGCASANLSPGDGRFFVFRASAPGVSTSIERYDAAAGQRQTVAAPPEGAAFVTTWLNRQTARRGATRVMSDDARTIFFTTRNALVPEDVNNRDDVYRWHDGDVALITSGRFAGGNQFQGTDVTGRTVFITTRERLVPQDVDAVFDLYAVRVDGGFLDRSGRSCDGDGCQGPPSPAALPAPAATVTFAGAGDPPSPQRPAAGRVSASKVKPVNGSVATLTIKVSGAGSVSVSGGSVRAVRRTAAKAGTLHVRVALTAKAVKTLKAKRRLTANVTVTFTPKAGAAATKRLTLSFREPKAAKRRAVRSHRSSVVKGGR